MKRLFAFVFAIVVAVIIINVIIVAVVVIAWKCATLFDSIDVVQKSLI